ncbi:MAG: hypothetical protein Kow0089_15760 [Desulfobulbaceae bacterium]
MVDTVYVTSRQEWKGHNPTERENMKLSEKPGRNLAGLALFVAVMLTASLALAHNKVVVVPLHGNAGGGTGGSQPLQNVVTVSPQNGDYTDPVTALDAITDASSTNPYTVYIGPGVYTLTQTLIMKSWVSIYGAGISSTILKFSTVANGVEGADNSLLSDLTIDSDGTGLANNVGLSNTSTSPLVRNVRIYVHSGSNMHGIYNTGSFASPVFEHVTVEVNANGLAAYGLSNWHSGTQARDVRISIDAYAGEATGVSNNFGSFCTLERATILVTGSSSATTLVGIANNDSNSELSLRQGSVALAATGSQTVQGVNSVSAQSFTAHGLEVGVGNARGVYGYGGKVTLLDTIVTSESDTGATVLGMEFDQSATVTGRTLSVTATGMNIVTGIQAANTTLDLMQTTIDSTGSTTDCKGIALTAGTGELRGGKITATSGGQAWGIDNDGGTFTVFDTKISASSSSFSGFGVYSATGGSTEVASGTVYGSSYSIYAPGSPNTGWVKALFSELTAAPGGTGNLTCVLTVNGSGTQYPSTCL